MRCTLLFALALAGCANVAPAQELPELECNMLDGGAIGDIGGWELVSCNRAPEPGELSHPASVCEPHGETYFCKWWLK